MPDLTKFYRTRRSDDSVGDFYEEGTWSVVGKTITLAFSDDSDSISGSATFYR